MKYFRRQNLNSSNILDDTVLQTASGNIELNPTQKVTIRGDLDIIGGAIPGPEVTNILYVTMDGDDNNSGTGEGPHQAKRSLKSALSVAQQGTTIYVRSGEYYEDNPLRMPPKVTIIGDSLRNTIIRPLNGAESIGIINIERVNNVTTITTAAAHGLSTEQRIRVRCASNDSVNETDVNILEIPAINQISYRQTGPNISATSATGKIKWAPDLFVVNSANYLANMVFKGLAAPAYCMVIDTDAIVDTSPYIQNCSNINGPWMRNGKEWLPFQTSQPNETGAPVTGPRPLLDDEIDPLQVDVYGIDVEGAGGGMLIDGDRYNSQSPIKSMVADAFTQVAQGGIGFHITNFGYMQLVSCFAVLCYKSFYTTRGGYLSISNSVCDFGLSGFEADGFYPDPYSSGITNQDYYSSVGSVTVTGTGSGFTSAPIIEFEPPTTPGGIRATAVASIDPTLGIINAVTMIENGSGYDFVPEITITPSYGAVARANLAKNQFIEVFNLANTPQIGSIMFTGDVDPLSGNEIGYYVTQLSNKSFTFKYDEQKCRRDVGLILNAVLSDAVLDTNHASTYAGISYLRSYSSKVTTLQKAQTIAGLEEARDQALTYTANSTMQTKITEGFNTVIAIINTGLSAVPAIVNNPTAVREPGYFEAAEILLANKTFIQEEVAAWINYTYSTFEYDRDKCSRDVKLILDAVLTDYMFGTNYGSRTAGLAYIRSYSSNVTSSQKSQTIAGLNHARDLALAYASDPATQIAITNGFSIVTNIINAVSGSGAPAISFTAPLTPVAFSYDAAAAQIEINKSFIADELAAYITDNLSPGTIPGYDEATCKRDVAYIIDAMAFDLYYGGNSATVGAALAYYNGVTNVVSGETAEFVSTFTRLQDVIPYIIQSDNAGWTRSVSNTSLQDVSLLAGSPTASTAAQALIQIIIDVVVGGTSSAPVVQKPIYSLGINYKLKNTYRQAVLIEDDKIAYDTVLWLDRTYGNFTYNEATCKRDIAYITDAVAYDLTYEGNTQTTNAALSYAAGNVIDGQIEQTQAAYEYWKNIVGQIVKNIPITPTPGNVVIQDTSYPLGTPANPDGPATKAETLIQIIVDVVDFGTGYVPDPVSYPEYVNGDPTLNIERNIILEDLSTIQTSVIVFLNNAYGGSTKVFIFPPITKVIEGTNIRFHNVSTISTASTAMEYVGSGVTYNALPFFGGEPDPTRERVEINNGKCFTVTSDQIGNYKIGQYFTVNALTGGVSINAEDLSLSGLSSIGPFNRNGVPVGVQLREISNNANLIASNGLQDVNTVPTQEAVATYVESRYVNKLTTNDQTITSNNITLTGDLGINGGDLYSTATTVNIFNRDDKDSITDNGPATVNAFLNATAIEIGAATGTTNINHNLDVDGDVNIDGGDLTVSTSTFNLANTNAITVNAFGAATIITVGDTGGSGILTLKNDSVVLYGDLEVRGGDVTTNQTTFRLVDTTATTVHFAGAATTLNIGDSATDSSTYNFASGVTGNTKTKNINIGTNAAVGSTVNITLGSTHGTNLLTINAPTVVGASADQHLFDTVATALHIGGAATTIDLGASTGTTHIRHNLDVDGDVNIDGGDLTVSTSTFNLVNTTATTVNAFGAATSIVIGSNAGTTNVKNNLDVDGDVNIDGGDLTVSTSTFNLVNTNATTVNFAGAATTVNIGGTTGTTTVKNNLDVDGDVNIDGGDLTVSTLIFNLANTTATTVNFAGAGTTVNIGSSSGTTNVKNNLDVDGDVNIDGGDLTVSTPTFNLANTTATTGNLFGAATTINIGAAGSAGTTTVKTDNVVLDGDLQVKGGDITTNQLTFNLLNTTSTTVNAFGAGTAIAIGAATGTTNIKNNLDVDGDVNIDGGDLTASTSTFNLLNTTVTTGNLFGVATGINLGTTAVGASTLTFGPAITGNTLKISSTASGTVNITTDATSGIANIFTSITDTTNIASSGIINLGNSSLSTTLVDIGGAITGNQLKISGTASGTVAITSDVTTGIVNLFNNITTGTVNIAGAGASTINVGSSTSTVNIGQLILTTDLAVPYGGTGVSTFTANGIVYGNNGSALQVTAASNPGSNATTSYGILTTDASNVPVWTDTIDGGSY
jgi:hypothetical protein